MIKYYRLFDLINRRGMKKTDLLEVISAGTLAKLSKGKNIQVDVIDKICLFLECQPSDIMECVLEEVEFPAEDVVTPDGKKYHIPKYKVHIRKELNEYGESEESTDIILPE